MAQWVVLFRGINVGGHHKLPMAELRGALVKLGFNDPKTYIQSGNLVLGSNRSGEEISRAIADLAEMQFGFRPDILVLSEDQFVETVQSCPFSGDGYDPSRVLVFFHLTPNVLFDAAVPENDNASELAAGPNAHYLHAPEGLSKSPLGEILSRRIGKQTTARNIRTCNKIMELLRS